MFVVGNLTRPEGLIDFGKIAAFLDPDSSGPFLYEIDWGDGTTKDSGEADAEETWPPAVGSIDASHVYADDGSYIVSITITDEQGMSATEQFELTVVVNAAPVASANGPYLVDEFATVQLSGSGADAPGRPADPRLRVGPGRRWPVRRNRRGGGARRRESTEPRFLGPRPDRARFLDGLPPLHRQCRSGRRVAQATIEIVNLPPAITVADESITIAEGATATNTGTYSDPGGDAVTLTASAGTIVDLGGGAGAGRLKPPTARMTPRPFRSPPPTATALPRSPLNWWSRTWPRAYPSTIRR